MLVKNDRNLKNIGGPIAHSTSPAAAKKNQQCAMLTLAV